MSRNMATLDYSSYLHEERLEKMHLTQKLDRGTDGNNSPMCRNQGYFKFMMHINTFLNPHATVFRIVQKSTTWPTNIQIYNVTHLKY